MNKQQRLIGIDLLRGVACYAVVILHSDEGLAAQPAFWQEIIQFAGFAVPFFLSTSFYLSINKLYNDRKAFRLAPRLKRLLIPYLLWTAIYLFYKAGKYTVSGQFGQVSHILHDPISITFLGGAAFHLYFLPLLLTGTLLVKTAEYLIQRKTTLKILVCLFVVSLVNYELLLETGNAFNIGSAIAFKSLLHSTFIEDNYYPLLRLILVWLAWSIRCLPYIFAAMIVSHPSSKRLMEKSMNQTVMLIFSWFLINAFGRCFLPASVHEISRGYLTLFLAIAVSTYLKPSFIISSMGACAFGIYLIHLLFIEGFDIINHRAGLALMPQPTSASLLAIAALVFLISWFCTFVLMRWKTAAKFLFSS